MSTIYRRFLLTGDSKTGITSLIHSFLSNVCAETLPTMPEFDYKANFSINDLNFELKILDDSVFSTFSESERSRFKPLTYSDVSAVILCYAADDRTSIENLTTKWIPEIR